MQPNYLDWALRLAEYQTPEGYRPHEWAVFPNAYMQMGAPYQSPVANAYNGFSADYSYPMAYNYDPSMGTAANGHVGDIGKLPNHPTFSNESAYSWGRNDAGRWVEPLSGNDWQYHNPARGMFYAPENGPGGPYEPQQQSQFRTILNGMQAGVPSSGSILGNYLK